MDKDIRYWLMVFQSQGASAVPDHRLEEMGRLRWIVGDDHDAPWLTRRGEEVLDMYLQDNEAPTAAGREVG